MNKPRLIDANAFYTNYCNRFEKTVDDGELDRMAYAIMHQPTAYDIDKVVEQLENLETYKQTVTMEKHPFCASEIETVSKKKAIEIVKGNYSEKPNSSSEVAE